MHMQLLSVSVVSTLSIDRIDHVMVHSGCSLEQNQQQDHGHQRLPVCNKWYNKTGICFPTWERFASKL